MRIMVMSAGEGALELIGFAWSLEAGSYYTDDLATGN